MKMLTSYPKVYNLGHAAITNLFIDPVVVQEKIDGSQISWGIKHGKLFVRSHHCNIDLDCPPKMFKKGVEYIQSIEHKLFPDIVYRCEYLEKPKHNVLEYNRIPKNHIVLFDINNQHEEYEPPDRVRFEAERLGLEPIKTFSVNRTGITSGDIDMLLDNESMLGGPKVEGIVFKNYNRFGRDGKALMGKHVSEKFKEQHKLAWKKTTKTEIINKIVKVFKTEARWNKAVQHLREQDLLVNEPKDIGPLLKELHKDFDNECVDEVKEMLWKEFRPKIVKAISAGFPQWYKDKLMKSQFGE